MRIALLIGLAALSAGCVVATSRKTAAPGTPEPKRAVATDGAPAAIGPYSQAVLAGDTLWVAGQIGIDPATGRLVPGGIAAETTRALANIHAILSAAGFTKSDVVQTQVFLASLDEFESMNEAYADFFGAVLPARATVEVAGLPRGARVEIVAVARR